MDIERYIDHAVLKPEMTTSEVTAAIAEGIKYHVYTVCVMPSAIDLALKMCKGTDTKVCCVLDFPHGTGGAEAKEMLAELYAAKGVAEIDMVMNYGFARSGAWDLVCDEISRVVNKAHAHGALVKVILETSMLSQEQIARATEIAIDAGADFVKTSTGFYGEGATEEGVATMLRIADGRIKVKPSGGIRDLKRAEMFVAMGASRLGVGYNSTKIISEGKAADAPSSPEEY